MFLLIKKYNSYSKQLKEIQTPIWKLKTLFKCKVIIKKKNHIILEYQQEPFLEPCVKCKKDL